MLDTWNLYNIVNQHYLNLKKKVKSSFYLGELSSCDKNCRHFSSVYHLSFVFVSGRFSH